MQNNFGARLGYDLSKAIMYKEENLSFELECTVRWPYSLMTRRMLFAEESLL